jgi:hypothetical protein
MSWIWFSFQIKYLLILLSLFKQIITLCFKIGHSHFVPNQFVTTAFQFDVYDTYSFEKQLKGPVRKQRANDSERFSSRFGFRTNFLPFRVSRLLMRSITCNNMPRCQLYLQMSNEN